MIYVVVVADSGIIEGVDLFHDEGRADAFAAREWREMTGSDEEGEDGWHDDDHDVWVFVADSFKDEEQD